MRNRIVGALPDRRNKSTAHTLIGLLRTTPEPSAPRADRVDWLLAVADAVDEMGNEDQAKATRARAAALIETAIDQTGGA